MTILTIKGHHFLIRSERENGQSALYALLVDDRGEILDPYPVAGGPGYTHRSLQVDLEADFLGEAEVKDVAFEDDDDDDDEDHGNFI